MPLGLERLEDRLALAVYLVQTTGDDSGLVPSGGNGSPGDPFLIGSLRSAIEQVNVDAGPDTILFDTSGVFAAPQTITLLGTHLEILDAVTIAGPGAANLTIDGNQLSRIFHIDDGNNANHLAVELSGLTLTGGNAAGSSGGAIFSRESLTVRDSIISGNTADLRGGGIATQTYSSGVTLIENCAISGNSSDNWGGGVVAEGFFGGTITIRNSTLAGNTARYGGGVYLHATAGGTTTLQSSAVSNNSTSAIGGGVLAIATSGGWANIQNSTLFGNSTFGQGGGLLSATANASLVTVRNSTISGNTASSGGGIQMGNGGISASSIESSIVANNFGGSPDLFTSGGTTVKFSLIGDNTGSGLAAAAAPDANGNLIGTSAAPIDPLLGPLANNGGPTNTMAITNESPAFGRGSPAGGVDVPTVDQRGTARATVGTIDMGAFESGPGNVTAHLTPAGKKATDLRLDIIGDAKAGAILLALGLGQSVKNSVRVSVPPGITINGQTDPVDFAGVTKGVSAELHSARGTFTVAGNSVAGPISLNGGAGDNTYIIASTKTKLAIADSGGTDTIDFSQWVIPAKGTKGASIDLAKQTGKSQSLGAGNSLKLTGQIENVVGSPLNDTLKGNAANNILRGGAGNDTLTGSGGHDILLGEAGNDKLTGSAATKKTPANANFDILIGGGGADKLTAGKKGNAILIGGTTDHDGDDAALLAILAEWTSGGSLNTRIDHLTGAVGGGQNGGTLLTSPGTVADDGLVDTLKNVFGNNWIFQSANDKLTGKKIDKAPIDVVQL